MRRPADGPSAAELERCRAQAEAHFLHRLQTVGGFGGKSDQLNAYNVYRDDPGYVGEDLARYGRATPGALQQAAAHWLSQPFVALGVVPTGQLALGLVDATPAEVA